MPTVQQQPAASARDSADKRHFQRYRARLDAVCITLRGAPQHRCEIRDLCLGGMLLNYQQDTARSFLPAVGEQVDIRCAVPGDAQQNMLRFRARVVRTDGESAGVALINPDPDTLQLLIDFAVAQQAGQRQEASPDGSAALDPASRRRLIEACNALARETVRPLVEDFIADAGGQLFDAADHARNATEQNSYFDALAIINRSHEIILQNFDKAYLEQLEARPNHPTGTGGAPGVAAAKLSLVEEDVLDDWLAVSDIANHIESRQHRELNNLERRLSHLYGTAVDKEMNPLGPYAFARSFQHMLKTLDLGRSANQVCYGSFKGALHEHLADLYARLNSCLIENGVLPDIKIGIVQRHKATPARKRKLPPGETAPEPRQDRQDNHQDSADGRDLYGIVRDIFSLRRQFGHHGADEGSSFDLELNSAPVPGASAESAGHRRPGVYTMEEVLSALSQLQAKNAATNAGAGVHSKILSLISDQAMLDDSGKRIGGREGGIMYVAGNVFESMFKDMLLENSVRSWLQRLEIPLLKQAILDESIFVDKSHVARQVVNRITQLELYGDGQEEGGNAIQRQVNTLLNRIASEIDVDPEIFSKVLKKLNALIHIQDAAYADNVRDVINACESEQTNAPDQPAQDADGESAGGDEAELQEWRKRAARLKTGSWMLFASEPSGPERLRLAWVSLKRDRFVFVNLRGLREKTLDIRQLCRQLHAGSAIILDGADEPAMDRAQYSMLQNLHHQLLFETTHDQLTGLVNRREFERRLQEKIEDARLGTAAHALLYIDIDQFNVINTTCGYDAGDRLLVEIGAQLKNAPDKAWLAGRIGADEFCLLLENCSTSEASRIAEEQIGKIRDYRFCWGDKRFSVSFGIGLSQIDGTCANAAQILQATESCCRAAKQQGMNRIQIHRPDDAALRSEQSSMKWISRIDKALDEGELDLRFQSIVPVAAEAMQQPHHVEVLLGVTDEDGNPISPQELILAAEHYHRMPAIDRWVIRSVFAWMAGNKDKVDAMGGLAINLSGRSLSDESFKDFILEEARKTGAPMDRVCFEVTETAGIGNLTDAAEFILDMKKSGCTFALDDFGSGLSSYAYLKNLPVDYLKIDGAFVKEMDRNPSDFAVVKSITEIGHFMGKQIIAEYVENDAILAMLREIGVDYAQGYVIDRPRRLFDFTG